eukprot:9760024-Lingulodinium_polyedra.AAC.1
MVTFATSPPTPTTPTTPRTQSFRVVPFSRWQRFLTQTRFRGMSGSVSAPGEAFLQRWKRVLLLKE